MRLFPKLPDNLGFWRKWNVCFVFFIGACLLTTRFFKNSPDVVNSAENLIWLGVAGLAIGFIMQFVKRN